MGIDGLYRTCAPRSVAVWAEADGPGRLVFENLVAGGFSGELVALSASLPEIAGRPCLADFDRLGASPDLVVLAAPPAALPELIAASGRAGANAVVVPTPVAPAAGLREACLAPAREFGLRLLGPRSWGIVNPHAALNAGLSRALPPAGGLAVVSQSRAVCASVLELSARRRIGLSILVGLGDGWEVDAADWLDYLAGHFRVEAILLHLEAVGAMRDFLSAARAAARVKPVVVLKSGRRHAERRARTPTGALIEVEAAYDAAFRRAGLIRVETVEDLFDCGDLVGRQKRPTGPRLAIAGNARSPGVMAADFLSRRGFEPAAFRPETRRSLAEAIGGPEPVDNPLVLWPHVGPEQIRRIVSLLAAAPEADGLLFVLTPHFLDDPVKTAQAVAAGAAAGRHPVFTAWLGGGEADAGRRILTEAGLPVYDGPERAVRAFLYLYDYERNLRQLQEIPPRQPDRLSAAGQRTAAIAAAALRRGETVLTLAESLDLLEAGGLPVVRGIVARTAGEAAAAADRLGYPAILTVLSRAGLHRRRLRRKGLHDPAEVVAAFEALAAAAREEGLAVAREGLLVQPEVVDPELELRAGFRRLPPFGPVLVFGYGGVRAGIPLDQAFGLPPLNRALARRLLEGTRIHRLLAGADPEAPLRGAAAALEAGMTAIGELAAERPEIVELEASPLILSGGRLAAAGATVVLAPAETPAPLHLVISPYPQHYAADTVTRAGIALHIRPIKPEDAPLLQALWATLSPRSIYLRFLKATQELSPELLVRFTQIDYDREVALVALAGAPERMLGVARLMWRPGDDAAEYAVVVGDPWQGQGVGAALLVRLCAIAIARGFKTIWGLVLRENRAMLELARKLGGVPQRGGDDAEVEVRLDLGSLRAPEILRAVAEIRG
jgi:acetyltransferase